MPRPSCVDCGRKHLAQACVLALEALKGYPEHAWLAVGHMAEAEDELVTKFPEIAAEIRHQRVRYIAGISAGDPSDATHPDFLSLIQDLTATQEGTDDVLQQVIPLEVSS